MQNILYNIEPAIQRVHLDQKQELNMISLKNTGVKIIPILVVVKILYAAFGKEHSFKIFCTVHRMFYLGGGDEKLQHK